MLYRFPSVGRSFGSVPDQVMRPSGWILLLPGTADSDAKLAEVAAMLKTAVPVSVAPPSPRPGSCGPSGLREVPPSPATPRWEIGLPTGATVWITPDVMPCNQTSTSYLTDDYATIGGRPMKLSQELPLLTPLTVTPAAVSAGGWCMLAPIAGASSGG